jgi:DNA-directed RNA polymerase beta' subunit
MRKFVHLIILAFIPILSFSQLQIKLPNDALHYRLDLKEGILWKERLSQKWTNEGKLASEGLILNDLPPNPNINCFKIDSHYVFTFPGTGQVYQFNLMKRQLKRLDKTYYRGFNFNAIQFVRKDTWILDTTGTNLLDALGLDYIDFERTYSNDIREIYNVLGIEAARQTLYNEIVEVMESSDAYINYHHLNLLYL